MTKLHESDPSLPVFRDSDALLATALQMGLPAVSRVLLYGSVARGEAAEESDVDVAVVFKEQISYEDVWQWPIEETVCATPGSKRLQIVLLTEDDLARPGSWKDDPAYLRNVLRDAVPLTDDPKDAPSLAQLQERMEADWREDAPRVAREQMQTARRRLRSARIRWDREAYTETVSFAHSAARHAMLAALASLEIDAPHSEFTKVFRAFDSRAVSGHPSLHSLLKVYLARLTDAFASWHVRSGDVERPEWADITPLLDATGSFIEGVADIFLSRKKAPRKRSPVKQAAGLSVTERTGELGSRVVDLSAQDPRILIDAWNQIPHKSIVAQWSDWERGFIRTINPSQTHCRRVDDAQTTIERLALRNGSVCSTSLFAAFFSQEDEDNGRPRMQPDAVYAVNGGQSAEVAVYRGAPAFAIDVEECGEDHFKPEVALAWGLKELWLITGKTIRFAAPSVLPANRPFRSATRCSINASTLRDARRFRQGNGSVRRLPPRVAAVRRLSPRALKSVRS